MRVCAWLGSRRSCWQGSVGEGAHCVIIISCMGSPVGRWWGRLMNRTWQECGGPSGVSGMAAATQENRGPEDLLAIASECCLPIQSAASFTLI